MSHFAAHPCNSEHFSFHIATFQLQLVSHPALFGYFQTLPGRYRSRKSPKSWKSTHLWTLSRNYKTTQTATICCGPLILNTFCVRAPLPTYSLSHIALLGYFWTLFQFKSPLLLPQGYSGLASTHKNKSPASEFPHNLCHCLLYTSPSPRDCS